MALGIFEQLDSLSTKLKRVCCLAQNVQEEQLRQAENNPCYAEILFTGWDSAPSVNDLATYVTTIDSTSVFPTGINIYDGDGEVIGWRLYGGKNLRFLGGFSDDRYLNSINDPCGMFTELAEASFTDSTIEYVNFPGVKEINYDFVFKSSYLKIANFPNLEKIDADQVFQGTKLTSINFPKLKTITGESNFAEISTLTSISFPSLTSIVGVFNFSKSSAPATLTTIYLPMCSVIGDPGDCAGYFSNFQNISPNVTSLTIKSILMTCDAGSPNEDVQYLIDYNPSMIITTT